MDFFTRQDQARRTTRGLVITFIIAVICIVAMLDLVAYGILVGTGDAVSAWEQAPKVFAIVSIGTLLLIGLASWYKWAQMSAGGSVVAESLGGRRVSPSTTDPRERVLINVVEEMSIASGVPMPEIYVLDQEAGINAFAAGLSTSDAVVAVTRGALDQFTRDELQGVIGHEFSHILNGDMRLNLKLIGVIHGILVLALAGRIMFSLVSHARVSRDDKKGGGIVVLILVAGLAMMVIGSIGWFFSMLIKAAVSRQREFLADASAVQFTRNPDGLAKALRRIAGLGDRGSRVANERAEEASHLFFGQAVSSLFATHPPLVERIGALEGRAPEHIANQFATSGTARPQVTGLAGATLAAGVSGLAESGPVIPRTAAPRAPVSAVGMSKRVGTVRPEDADASRALLANIPSLLRQAAQEGFSARAVALALICDPSATVREIQLAFLSRRADAGLTRAVGQLLPSLEALDRSATLPLLHLCLPALRQLSEAQRREFLSVAVDLVRRDGLISLHEFALVRVLNNHLAGARPAATISDWEQLLSSAGVVLSALAHAGGAASARAEFDAGVAVLPAKGGLTFHPPSSCSSSALDNALYRLSQATPERKRVLVDAFARTVAADGVITVREGELLRVICDSLDCPLPPFAGVSTAA